MRRPWPFLDLSCFCKCLILKCLEYAPQESNSTAVLREKQASPDTDDAPDDALSGNSSVLDALAALVSQLTPEQRAALGGMLKG